MTFESILPINTPCPLCGAIVKAGETGCPSCGADLQKSLIEEEALRYRKELEQTKRKRSNLAMIIFILATFLVFLVAKLFYEDHYEMKASGMTDEEGLYFFATLCALTFIFLTLTILCYFKPLAASIAGLCVFTLLTAFIVISIITEKEPIIREGEFGIAVVVWVIYLLFPAGLTLAIYRLKKTSLPAAGTS